MGINAKLVKAIGASGLDFEDVAIFANIFSNYLVKIIRGELIPDTETKRKLSVILDMEVSDLFPVE